MNFLCLQLFGHLNGTCILSSTVVQVGCISVAVIHPDSAVHELPDFHNLYQLSYGTPGLGSEKIFKEI